MPSKTRLSNQKTKSQILWHGGVLCALTALLLPLCLIIGGCESLMPHPRTWTKREKIAAGFFIATHTLNAYSTEKHQDYPGYYHETNPLMGRHPSDTEIGVYFSLTGIGTLLIAHWYPELREPLLYGYGGLNLGLAVNDFKMLENGNHNN